MIVSCLCPAAANLSWIFSVETLLVSSFRLQRNGLSSVCVLLLIGSLEALLKSIANSTSAGTAPGSIAVMVRQAKGRARVNFNYDLCSATDIGRLFSHHGLRILTKMSISTRWLLATCKVRLLQLPNGQTNCGS